MAINEGGFFSGTSAGRFTGVQQGIGGGLVNAGALGGQQDFQNSVLRSQDLLITSNIAATNIALNPIRSEWEVEAKLERGPFSFREILQAETDRWLEGIDWTS